MTCFLVVVVGAMVVGDGVGANVVVAVVGAGVGAGVCTTGAENERMYTQSRMYPWSRK